MENTKPPVRQLEESVESLRPSRDLRDEDSPGRIPSEGDCKMEDHIQQPSELTSGVTDPSTQKPQVDEASPKNAPSVPVETPPPVAFERQGLSFGCQTNTAHCNIFAPQQSPFTFPPPPLNNVYDPQPFPFLQHNPNPFGTSRPMRPVAPQNSIFCNASTNAAVAALEASQNQNSSLFGPCQFRHKAKSNSNIFSDNPAPTNIFGNSNQHATSNIFGNSNRPAPFSGFGQNSAQMRRSRSRSRSRSMFTSNQQQGMSFGKDCEQVNQAPCGPFSVLPESHHNHPSQIQRRNSLGNQSTLFNNSPLTQSQPFGFSQHQKTQPSCQRKNKGCPMFNSNSMNNMNNMNNNMNSNMNSMSNMCSMGNMGNMGRMGNMWNMGNMGMMNCFPQNGCQNMGSNWGWGPCSSPYPYWGMPSMQGYPGMMPPYGMYPGNSWSSMPMMPPQGWNTNSSKGNRCGWMNQNPNCMSVPIEKYREAMQEICRLRRIVQQYRTLSNSFERHAHHKRERRSRSRSVSRDKKRCQRQRSADSSRLHCTQQNQSQSRCNSNKHYVLKCSGSIQAPNPTSIFSSPQTSARHISLKVQKLSNYLDLMEKIRHLIVPQTGIFINTNKCLLQIANLKKNNLQYDLLFNAKHVYDPRIRNGHYLIQETNKSCFIFGNNFGYIAWQGKVSSQHIMNSCEILNMNFKSTSRRSSLGTEVVVVLFCNNNRSVSDAKRFCHKMNAKFISFNEVGNGDSRMVLRMTLSV